MNGTDTSVRAEVVEHDDVYRLRLPHSDDAGAYAFRWFRVRHPETGAWMHARAMYRVATARTKDIYEINGFWGSPSVYDPVLGI